MDLPNKLGTTAPLWTDPSWVRSGGVLLALLAAGCGATRKPLETARPWEVATQAVNHPPQLIDVVKPTLSYLPKPGGEVIPPALRDKVTLRSEAIDIRSLMLGLAKQTGLNITLDPDVAGQVSAYFTDVEVYTALQQIADQLGAEVEVHDNVISVHRPRTEIRMYRLHYTKNTRAGISGINVIDRASSSTVGTLAGGATFNNSSTASAGAAVVKADSTGSIAAAPKLNLGAGDSLHYITSQFVENFWEDLGGQLRVIVFEGDTDKDLVVNANHNSSGMNVADSVGRMMIVDPMSGTIVIKARRPVLDEVGEYIKAVDITVHRQVVIDVRILEVDLSDQTIFGIDSQNTPLLASQAMKQISQTIFGPNEGNLFDQLVTSGYSSPLGFPNPTGSSSLNLPPLTPSTQPYGITLGGSFREVNPNYQQGVAISSSNQPYIQAPFALLIQALGGLSDTRVIASPRLTAMHNQRALLKVVKDRVFFLFQPGTVVAGTNGSAPVITASTAYPVIVPEGVVLDITPVIDDNGEVTLEVHPSFSTILDTVQAPSGEGSEPEVERREFETTVHVKGEETIMMGGLVSETSSRTESGIPFLKDIPYLGGLFRDTNDSTTKQEIIMLLTPRVQGPTVARDSVNQLRTLSDQDPIPVVAPPLEPTAGSPAPSATGSPPSAPKGP